MPGVRAHLPAEEGQLVDSALVEHYRCPEQFAAFTLTGEPSEDEGYFRFGADAICYGRSSSGYRAKSVTHELYDALSDVGADGRTLRLPFNPSDVILNLRYERYTAASHRNGKVAPSSVINRAYYLARPFLALSVRKHLQRMWLRDWVDIRFPHWPVDPTVEHIFERLLLLTLKAQSIEKIPFIWFWPDGAQSCVIMTHDVETARGKSFCSQLMDLDDQFGIKASFQIVPEGRYPISGRFLDSIRDRGFEVNVHDLNHDGHLFLDKKQFLRRAERINQYGREFTAAGFRAAVLNRNLEWLRKLDFAYDMSVPSVGHLDAQRGGCCSVMPFFVGKMLELPVTTTQDYTLFNIFNQYSIDLWKQQTTLITKKHGLVSFIIHPDYVIGQRARETYKKLLGYLSQLRSEGKTWFALPKAVNDWWRDRSRMKLLRRGNKWEIDGPNKERARVAFASFDGNKIVYRLQAFLTFFALHGVAEAASGPAIVDNPAVGPVHALSFSLLLLARFACWASTQVQSLASAGS